MRQKKKETTVRRVFAPKGRAPPRRRGRHLGGLSFFIEAPFLGGEIEKPDPQQEDIKIAPLAYACRRFFCVPFLSG
jgi:hypothetical protein